MNSVAPRIGPEQSREGVCWTHERIAFPSSKCTTDSAATAAGRMKFFVRTLLVCAAFFLALALFLEWREYREAQRWEAFWELMFEMFPPTQKPG